MDSAKPLTLDLHERVVLGVEVPFWSDGCQNRDAKQTRKMSQAKNAAPFDDVSVPRTPQTTNPAR